MLSGTGSARLRGKCGSLLAGLAESAVLRWRHAPAAPERDLEPAHRAEAGGEAYVGDRRITAGEQPGGVGEALFDQVAMRRAAGDLAENMDHPRPAQP